MYKIKVDLNVKSFTEENEYGTAVCSYDRSFELEYKEAKILFDMLAKLADATEEGAENGN